MKKRNLVSKFTITMSALCICIVLLWVVFYAVTLRNTKNSIALQADAGSDVVFSGLEEKFIVLNESTATLAKYDKIVDMVSTDNEEDFHAKGVEVSEYSDLLVGEAVPAENVIVYKTDGTYYRVRGAMFDTALYRVNDLINKEDSKAIAININKNMYIGSSEPVLVNGEVMGHVVLLMEKSRLKNIIDSFSNVDYLGIALMTNDEVIYSNRNIEAKDISSLKKEYDIYKESEIGLTGFKLFIYCDDTITKPITTYFYIAMPVTVIILIIGVSLFVIYWKRHMMEPINNIIANTKIDMDEPLPHTGEEYFDGMVDHINSMMSCIEEREKELFDSKIQMKESELEKERSLILLLKKQISAHFTVNTLNAVRALINTGETEKAVHMCDELSTLLRYANAGEEFISLQEEFFVLEQYASIMQTRYPGRFTFFADANDDFDEVYIPRMLLQPIVENAILYGFADKQGDITVDAQVGSTIVITVSDNGRGMSIEELRAIRHKIDSMDVASSPEIKHIALANIERRIRLVCGEGYGIMVKSVLGKGTDVIITLPNRIKS